MSDKTVIVYKSKTGFTKRYAEMIAGEVGCALLDFKEASPSELAKYDTVIFGTRLFAGSIDGFQKAKEMFAASGAKNLILFVTGASPNDMTEVLDEIWKKNLTEEELSALPYFYLQSGLNYANMPVGDKAMIKIAAAVLKHKKPKDAFEAGFAEATAASYDISSPEYIKPLVEYLKNNH